MENTMAETNGAASSPAESVDVFGGLQPTMSEYSSYRSTGELPDRFKSNATVTDAPEETVDEPAAEEAESDSESDTEEAQEPAPKGSPAQKRILQLLAENKRLKAERETAQPVATPAPAPQPATRQKPAIDAKDDKGQPKYASYEDYIEDLADWKSEQRMLQFKREQVEQAALNSLKAKLEESRSRYSDADEVIFPAADAIRNANIPMAVKEVFAQSDVFTDLCYVVGSDKEELKKFIQLSQTNPRAALARVFEYERGVKEELAKGNAVEPDVKAPERKTTAPKPPSPVSGASSRAFDVSDESLSAEEWARKRNAQLQKRGKSL
jgi:hypothetical protein